MKIDTVDLSANLPIAIETTKNELLYNYECFKVYPEFSTGSLIHKNACMTLCRILAFLLKGIIIEKDSELELTLEKLKSIMVELGLEY